MMQPLNEDINTIFDVVAKYIEKGVNPAGKGQGKYLGGSISNYAKNLVMTFPCMCDNSLSPETASMISRANERNIITMLELLFASAQMQGQDGMDIINSIHNNIKSNFNIDDYIDAVDTYANAFRESNGLTKAEMARIITEMVEELKKPAKRFPVSSFSESSINDYTIYNRGGVNNIVNEGKKSKNNSNYNGSNTRTTKYTDDNGNDRTNSQTKNVKNYSAVTPEMLSQMTMDDLEYLVKQGQLSDQTMSSILKELDYRIKLGQIDDREYNRLKDQIAQSQQLYRDKMEFIQKRLLDTDVKKANEMQPSLMVVNFNLTGGAGNQIQDRRSFVAGVKSRLISVDSIDIMERILAKNTTKINFANFIKATTGEISFVKDFLLSVNQAKIDAKNASKKGLAANMWKTLENRSIKNNWNKLRKAGNDASAITTLVISQETVNLIKNQGNFDITKWKNAQFVMDTYNLMGIIICDDSLEVAKFLYAGNDEWETQAYAFLEKDAKRNDPKTMNLLNKKQY